MDLEAEINNLKHRNQRVEAEKAWETSTFRKMVIVMVTYVFAVVLMMVIGVVNPFLNALVPTMGFFLSTLSISFLKSIWIKKIYNKKPL